LSSEPSWAFVGLVERKDGLAVGKDCQCLAPHV